MRSFFHTKVLARVRARVCSLCMCKYLFGCARQGVTDFFFFCWQTIGFGHGDFAYRKAKFVTRAVTLHYGYATGKKDDAIYACCVYP